MFGNEKNPLQNQQTTNGFNGDLLMGAEGVKTGGTTNVNGAGGGVTAATTSTMTINTMKSGEHSNRRKKPTKTRQPQTQNSLNNSNYPSSLDAWLENCLKDAGNAQLSSSSEFLDFQMPNLTQRIKEQSPRQQQPQFFLKSKFQPQLQTHNNYFKGSSPYMNKFTLPDMSQHILQPEGDFASLPPIINFIGSEHEQNSTDVLNGSNPNNSRDFRFSDPCLVNPSDNESKMSGLMQDGAQQVQGTAADTDSNSNNKFFLALMEQINLLHETNSKICRNLHETKVEVEALKHAPTWGLKHRRDSISGLSTHSQPMNFAFGTHSPAPTYHSGMYTPGMMTDVVREVKEAARVREDALLNRVKSMVEERSWSQSEGNMRILREIEELKSQVQHLKSDRKESHRRIAQLETENKYIRQIIGTLLNNRSIDIHLDQSRPKKRVQQHQSHPQPQLNLNYGVINEETSLTSLHINESPESSTKSEQNDFETPEIQELRRQLQDAMTTKRQEQNRIIAIEKKLKELNNCGSNNGIGSNCGGNIGNSIPTSNGDGNTNHQHHNSTSSKFSIAGPITDL